MAVKFLIINLNFIWVALPSTGNETSKLFSHSSFLIRVATPSLGAILKGSGGNGDMYCNPYESRSSYNFLKF